MALEAVSGNANLPVGVFRTEATQNANREIGVPRVD